MKRVLNGILDPFFRLLLRNRFISGEKGKNGKGIWARNNKSSIKCFEYHFNGSVGGNNFSLKVAENDKGVYLFYKSMEYPEIGDARIKVDKSVIDKLNNLYLKCRIAGWNGYSRYNPRILDGSGFSLNIRFNDGAVLNASGTNAFPDRYDDFSDELLRIIDPIKDGIFKPSDG